MKYTILDVLRVKSFAFLLGAELFTQLAANIFNFYLILLVFSLTKSNTAVAGIILSFTIPAIFFGILAGVYVDRWDKKTVLFLSNSIRAVLLFILVFFYQNIIVIFIISFLVAIFTQFFIPAESPMIPLVVKKKALLSANALFGLGLYGSVLVAFILSGPVIIFFGQANTLIVLSVFFLISCGFIWLIRPRSEKRGSPVAPTAVINTIKDEVKGVLRHLSQTKEIHHALFMLALSQVLILIISALAPGYAANVLNVSVEDFPLLFIAPAALGVFFGAIVLAQKFHATKKDTLITAGLFLSGLAMLALPYGSKLAARDIIVTINQYLPGFLDINIMHIVTMLAFLLGFANAFVFVPSNTILQEKTSDEMRGRVYGVLNTVVGLFSLFPLLLVGAFSDLFGVNAVVVSIGICLVLLSFARKVFRL